MLQLSRAGRQITGDIAKREGYSTDAALGAAIDSVVPSGAVPQQTSTETAAGMDIFAAIDKLAELRARL